MNDVSTSSWEDAVAQATALLHQCQQIVDIDARDEEVGRDLEDENGADEEGSMYAFARELTRKKRLLKQEVAKFRESKEGDVATVLNQNQELHSEMLQLRVWELANVLSIKDVLTKRFLHQTEEILHGHIDTLNALASRPEGELRRVDKVVEQMLETTFEQLSQNRDRDFPFERDILRPLLKKKKDRAFEWMDDCEVRSRAVAQTLIKYCNEENNELMARIEQHYRARIEALKEIQQIEESIDAENTVDNVELTTTSTTIEGKYRQAYLHILELAKIGNEVKTDETFTFRETEPSWDANDLGRMTVEELRSRVDAHVREANDKMTKLYDTPIADTATKARRDLIAEANEKIKEVKTLLIPNAISRLQNFLSDARDKDMDVTIHAPKESIKEGKHAEIRHKRVAFEKEVFALEKKLLARRRRQFILMIEKRLQDVKTWIDDTAKYMSRRSEATFLTELCHLCIRVIDADIVRWRHINASALPCEDARPLQGLQFTSDMDTRAKLDSMGRCLHFISEKPIAHPAFNVHEFLKCMREEFSRRMEALRLITCGASSNKLHVDAAQTNT